jgi:superfamily I DNA and/or RNA helicase
VIVDEASQVRVAEAAIAISAVADHGRLILAGDDLQLPPIVQGVYPEGDEDALMLHRSIFEAVRSAVPDDPPVVAKLLENRRMNDVLTSCAAGLLYGPDYRCFDDSIAARRLNLSPGASLVGLTEACLAPNYPLTVVVLEGVQATKRSLVEARLVSDLVIALRDHLLADSGTPYGSDQEFFRRGLFMVSPHRAQNRAIQQELRNRRAWQVTPFADTVDKMQGQEAEAVLVSYGVADPEYALLEAEFIYSVNRLNVAITRAKSKCVVFLPRPLLDSLPGVINQPEAERGLAFMRSLVDVTSQYGITSRFDLGDGIRAIVHQMGTVL